jgi:hypothetical protein
VGYLENGPSLDLTSINASAMQLKWLNIAQMEHAADRRQKKNLLKNALEDVAASDCELDVSVWAKEASS